MALTKISRGLLSTGVSDSSDATAITIDSSERVGIGTSSPSKKLHVEMSGDAALFDRTASAGGVMQFASGGTVKGNVGVQSGGFGLGGGFRDPDLFVATGGNVGIGTTSPASKFHVKVGTDNNLEIEETGGDLRLLAINDARAVNVPMEFAASRFEFLTGNVGIQTSGTVGDPLVVTDSGASSVTARLINTNADANPANLRLQKLSTSPADNDYIGMINVSGENDASEETIFQSIDFIATDVSDGTEDGNIVFRTISAGTLAERIRITSDGKLGIGTTGPDEKLQVNGKLKVSSSFGTGTSVIIQNNDSSDNFSAIGFYSGGTVAGYVFVNGSLNQTSYQTSSDYRLKENVNYSWNGLEKVKQLKPAEFNMISDEENTVLIGFLAHEVSDIVPEAISGEKDGEQMQGIDHSRLVPLLTKAIQELSTKLEAAEARITALEG